MANERKKIRRSRIETLRDDSALCYNGYGFTLIELLVVVLIIGILAAVALPQYQKAVEKSHVMTLISAMKSIADAEESYYLANGEYTVDVETLSVDMPAGATGPTAENLYTLPNGQKISTNGMQLSQKTLYGGTSRIQIDWVLQHSNWPSFAPGIYCGADPTDSIGIQVCKSLGSNGQKANTVNVGCGIFTATPIYCDWYNISL